VVGVISSGFNEFYFLDVGVKDKEINSTPLLPCPKCGHIPDANDPDFFYPLTRSGTVYSINCWDGGDDSCDYRIMTNTDDVRQAIKFWNNNNK
jgi:hypothetical protein